jgi:hypothetical protein
MSGFGKLLIGSLLVLLVGLPALGAWRGWGLPPQTDPRALAAYGPACSATQRDPQGRCRGSVGGRSVSGRSHRGGGPRFGK